MAAFSRRKTLRINNTSVEMFVNAHGSDGYRVEARLMGGFTRGAFFVTRYVAKADLTEGIMATAEQIVRDALADVQAEAQKSWTFVRVDNLPGYARDAVDTSGMDEAAYWMDSKRGVPVTVFRVWDTSVLDAFVQAVDGKSFFERAEDADKVATVTLFAGVGLVEALMTEDGYPDTPGDAVTALALPAMKALKEQAEREAKFDDDLVRKIAAMSPERVERVLSRARALRATPVAEPEI